jgi:hypothetical protein
MQDIISTSSTAASQTSEKVSAISTTAAKLSFGAAAAFLVLLAALHIVKPDFDPSWRMISEYAIGHFGWAMKLAFLAMAFSFAALFVAIRTQVQTVVGKIGLVLMPIVAVTLATAAFFTMDPITTSQSELTVHGSIHGLAAMIGNPGSVLAALLISISLLRNPDWKSARLALMLVGNLPWISLALMFAVMGGTLAQAGGFGPGVPIGWPNRFIVVAYSIWLMTLAWHTIKLHQQAHSLSSR